MEYRMDFVFGAAYRADVGRHGNAQIERPAYCARATA